MRGGLAPSLCLADTVTSLILLFSHPWITFMCKTILSYFKFLRSRLIICMHVVMPVTNFLSRDTSVQLQLNPRQDMIYIIVLGCTYPEAISG